MQAAAVDPNAVLNELHLVRGGVVDTSTLIYLERLGVLPLAADRFSLLVIPRVIAEYGGCPEGCPPIPASEPGTTDEQLCRVAQRLGQPVLSEDRQVLRRARALHLPYYNTLMLVLALCVQNRLPLHTCRDLLARLHVFARYGPEVLAVGDAVYRALDQSLESRR